MALRLSETHPPSPEQAIHATAVHAALVEAGYPEAHVSATEHLTIVSTYWHDIETGEVRELPEDVADRAFAICERLRPASASLGDAKAVLR